MRGKIVFLSLCVVSLITCYIFLYKSNVLLNSNSHIKILNYELANENNTEELYLFDVRPFKYLLNGNVCEKGNRNILAVILVQSYYSNIETRSAMRRAFTGRELMQFDMRRVFLLALPPSGENYNYEAILNEQQRFGDLVQGNFIEAYRNLTYKHIMGLKWAIKHCSNAKYIVKMDDDIVVDMYKLSDYLHNPVRGKLPLPGPMKNEIAGFRQQGSPLRIRESKWYVTYEEYSANNYPTYLSGWFYILTQPAAREIVAESRNVAYFWIDDVYVTGILTRNTGVKLLDIKESFATNEETLQCCVSDFKKERLACPVMVGPNGGDNNLFFTYNEMLSACFITKCKRRVKPLNETCRAQQKIFYGRGKPIVMTVPIF